MSLDMQKIVILFLIYPLVLLGQKNEVKQDTMTSGYIKIAGDSIFRTSIDLDEVMLLHKLKFDSNEDKRRYLILKRKTVKVYHYSTLAATRLDSLKARLERYQKKSDKKRYAKKIQQYIEGEFSDELKKLTRTEGQILIKLIHRQTGITTFDLIKELRNGWRAFWFNNTASLFDLSLKKTYDPMRIKEDYLIEDILQRNFQNGVLERRKDALGLDFFELSNKWMNLTPKQPPSSGRANKI